MRYFITILVIAMATAAQAVNAIVDIPIRYVKNTVLVDHVRINGRGDYTFLVDTGSTACTITSEVADELGLSRDGWSDVSAIGGTRKLRVAKVASVTVGNARVDNPLTLIADDNGLTKHVGCPVNGVLGTPFLWKWPVQVDYPAERLRIFPNEYDLRTEPVESPWSSVGTLKMKGRAAYVQVAVNGAAPHEMMLDTGATGVVLTAERAREAKASAAPWQSSSVGAFGPRRESAYWRLDSVRVAGLTVTNAQGFTPQQMGDWRSDQLGNDALDQFRLTVDATRHIYRLERDQMPDHFEDSPWGAGISVRRDVDAMRIAHVWPGGEAATQGIASGDTLVTVDDQDAGSLPPDALRDLLNQPPGYTVSLVVKTSAGPIRNLELKSQRYTRKRPTDSIATSVSVVQPKKIK